MSHVLVHILIPLNLLVNFLKNGYAGVITFIYKNRGKYDISNYRPIAITNNI